MPSTSCSTCDQRFNTQRAYDSHMSSQGHAQRVGLVEQSSSDSTAAVLCPTCNRLFPSRADFNIHASNKAHIDRVSREQIAARLELPAPERPSPNYRNCPICNILVRHSDWDSHVTRVSHRRGEQTSSRRAAVRETERSQGGLELSHGDTGVDFGVVEPVSASGALANSVTIWITARATGSSRILYRRWQATPGNPLRFEVTSDNNTNIGQSTQNILSVAFNPTGKRGKYENRLELHFRDLTSNTNFTVTRLVRATAGFQSDLEILGPATPFVGTGRRHRVGHTRVIKGERREPVYAIPWVVPLLEYPIPPEISSVLESGGSRQRADDIQANFLPQSLTSTQTHCQYWGTLLHVEEHQMTRDLERFDMHGVRLMYSNNHYLLRIPGLAEKRPSVMKGDIIKVINPQGEAYEGRVGMIQDLHAGLSFHPSFRNVPGRLYNVEFLLNRNPLQRMHRALHQNFPMTRILFPAVEDIADASVAPVEAFQNAPLYNPLVAQNLPQLQAVASIVTQPAGSTPFVVFGPPGTGKTVTIVEAILQILKRTPAARILACAPSNSAADLIAKRLIAFGQLKPNELFRLIAPSCSLDIPTILKRYTFIHEGVFAVPRGNDPLGAYRVIVSTCVSADVPFGIGMELGHFSHIFIDEAGQALEPEVMIPIKTIADHRTNIILSGDPKQLGPVIHSPVGRILGLGVSYLDRLMAQDMYSSTVGHGLTTVKLVKNFRSHSAILNFSNEQFYEGELQVRGDPDIINSLIDWEGLVTPKFPVIFHGIAGQDLREGISPSYFNPDEASLVKEYVSALRSNASLGLDDSHIGVIAPYSAQCAKIRLLLKTQYPEINIGSAEQFQGQERRVIIISTVRSSREEVEFDLRHTLGFVANQRRFNVAVTRAQALLIVIGDPSVLSLDSMWREFMRYVSDNGGWRGVTMDGPQEEVYETNEAYVQSRRARAESQIQELVERVSGGGDVADDDGGGEVAADSPWRVME